VQLTPDDLALLHGQALAQRLLLAQWYAAAAARHDDPEAAVRASFEAFKRMLGEVDHELRPAPGLSDAAARITEGAHAELHAAMEVTLDLVRRIKAIGA
jgi:hypothetical protein